jgi:hypothetical protein
MEAQDEHVVREIEGTLHRFLAEHRHELVGAMR